MDSAVDRRNADETAAMLQLDPSDNPLWRPVVLQDTDLDVGISEINNREWQVAIENMLCQKSKGCF